MELLRICAFENWEDFERNVAGRVFGGMGMDWETDKTPS